MPFDPELLKQLIESFYTELDEHAQVIIKSLLILEKGNLSNDEYTKAIKDIFRSAHNIKGTSRGLGISGLGEISHRIESLFTEIQKRNFLITPQIIDVCLDAVDKMKSVLDAFVEKTPLPFDLDELLQHLEMEKLLSHQQDSISNVSNAESNVASPKNKPDEVETPNIEIPEIEVPQIETPQIETPTIETPDIEIPETPTQIDSVNKNSSKINKKNGQKTTTKAEKHASIRVPITKIEKISSILEEIQVSKIAITELCSELSNLENKSKQFAFMWHKLLTSVEKHNTNDSFDQMKAMFDVSNDQFIDLLKMTQHLNTNMHTSVNELSLLSHTLQEEVGMMRMVPIGNLLCNFPRYVRDLSQQLHKKVELTIKGDEVKVDKAILEGLNDPFIHLLRNAIDHGIETPAARVQKGKSEVGHINIEIKKEEGQIIIEITDDGGGIDSKKIVSIAEYKNLFSKQELDLMSEAEKLELIFKPGFSTKEIISDISGRGVGLDVVKANIEDLQGHIKVTTELGKGSMFTLSMPISIVSERGLLVRCQGDLFVIPITAVERVLLLTTKDLVDVQGRQAIIYENRAMHLTTLADILKLKTTATDLPEKLPIVIIKKRGKAIALVVDEILNEREIVIKQLNQPLTKVSCIAGGTLLESNQVILVLEPNDLIHHALKIGKARGLSRIKAATDASQISERIQILVVDDSITTRTLEKSILESRNYQVTLAVNGKEALDILQKKKFSLVITDVMMPIMDGFTLTEQIKKKEELRDMPVIIVTSLGSDAEKKRGIDVGADAYIIKNEFESGNLLDIVAQLV